MSSPRQHRFARPLLRNRFRYVAAALLSTVLLSIGSAMAWAEESITLDFVRHGQTLDNATGIIDTTPPGTELTETGQQQAQAVAEDGWSLVSFDGQPVPPASLPTELFVDVRDLITAPQLAAYNIWEAILTGDPTTIVNAIRDGFSEVSAAMAQFPSR